MLEKWPRSLRLHKPLIKWANVFSNQAKKWKWDVDPVSNLRRFLPAVVLVFFSFCPKPFRSCFCFQEMLAILKSIYDMMGRYTYPCVRDEAPYEHVDKFFQVVNAQRQKTKSKTFFVTCRFGFCVYVCVYFTLENGQKPGRCRDHWRVHWDLPEGLCFYNLLLHRFTDFIYLLYAL